MIRSMVRQAIAERLVDPAAELGATVYRYPSFTDPAPNRITLVMRDIPGDLALPVYSGDDKSKSSDTWRLVAYCRADAALQTVEDAELLAEDLAEVVRVTVHTDPSLGGIIRATAIPGRRWILEHVTAVQVSGPEILEFEDGPCGLCTVTLEAFARVF